MAGLVAVAAGAVMPGVASSISTIFSQVGSVMATASTQGSLKQRQQSRAVYVGFDAPAE